MRGFQHDAERGEKRFCAGGRDAMLFQSAHHVADAGWPFRRVASVDHEIPQGPLDLDAQLDDGHERKFARQFLDGRRVALKLWGQDWREPVKSVDSGLGRGSGYLNACEAITILNE